MSLRIGVDVGGTNTDAVLMDERRVLAKLKTPTTEDVTGGITTAIRSVLTQSGTATESIASVMIGTTHFTNAIIERKHLEPVAIIRLGLPATSALPPMIDWPEDLLESLPHYSYLAHGGHEFDGREISAFDPEEIRAAARDIAAKGVKAIAISSVFSPVNPSMEDAAAVIVIEVIPDATITKSSEIGRIGLLERENAALLNSCLRALADRTVTAFQKSITDLGITAPLYLTQNDGTLMAADFARTYPVLTIASGPTNSMRGAAFSLDSPTRSSSTLEERLPMSASWRTGSRARRRSQSKSAEFAPTSGCPTSIRSGSAVARWSIWKAWSSDRKVWASG